MKLIKYFQKEYGIDLPGDVTWSHATNSQERLDRMLNDTGIMMIESDISLSPGGIPIAAHPPQTESDLSCEQLVNQVKQSNKGLKVDFKDPRALIPCLQLLKELKLEQPIMLNADILQGNQAYIPKFEPAEFIELCKKYLPSGMLSLGWTTVGGPISAYTLQNIDEMRKFSDQLEEVTFPIRACFLPNSWQYISSLIKNEGQTFTIWNNEPVEDDLRGWIKSNTDPSKTFYDLIDEDKNPIRL